VYSNGDAVMPAALLIPALVAVLLARESALALRRLRARQGAHARLEPPSEGHPDRHLGLSRARFTSADCSATGAPRLLDQRPRGARSSRESTRTGASHPPTCSGRCDPARASSSTATSHPRDSRYARDRLARLDQGRSAARPVPSRRARPRDRRPSTDWVYGRQPSVALPALRANSTSRLEGRNLMTHPEPTRGLEPRTPSLRVIGRISAERMVEPNRLTEATSCATRVPICAAPAPLGGTRRHATGIAHRSIAPSTRRPASCARPAPNSPTRR
jgi:hypothetical protein